MLIFKSIIIIFDGWWSALREKPDHTKPCQTKFKNFNQTSQFQTQKDRYLFSATTGWPTILIC